MICFSETYLDSSYADDDTRLNSKDSPLIRADNRHNCKRGRVRIYFKEHLSVSPVSPLTLNECLVLGINPLSANFTKWSNTPKQFVEFCRRIV